MKKISILLVFFISLLSLSNAKAQVPGVDLIYAGDSSWNFNCSVPATVDMMFYGYASGYGIGDSILIEINFGDGTSTSYLMSIVQGTTFYDIITHVYTMPGSYSVQYIATGPDGASDTLVDDEVLISSSCGDISGQAYFDLNGDCVFNTGDIPYNGWVNVNYNGNSYGGTQTDQNGNYFITVPSGFTYDISIGYSNLTFNCPSSGSYTVSTLPSAGNDFAITCNGSFDYTATISGQGFRVNNTTSFYLNAFNALLGCTAPNATITVDLDPMLTFVSSVATPVSSTSNQVVFNAGQLIGTNHFNTGITVLTNIGAQIGDTLCITITIDPQAGDDDPSNNVVTVCMPVRNSCDPNEKYEIHAGAGTATVAPGTELSYTIMFQNVGNDVAFDVDIIDELDPNLDLSTLQFTGFSHNARVYLNNGVLKFEFDNINLAAASVNEPMSHGYVSYKIMPLSNLPNGTAIENSADIYFDFNEAIVTNTVTDIIDQSTGLNDILSSSMLQAYPNPASDYFTVITGSDKISRLSVYDVTGRLISEINVSDRQVLGTSGLQQGYYILKLESDRGISTTTLTIK